MTVLPSVNICNFIQDLGNWCKCQQFYKDSMLKTTAEKLEREDLKRNWSIQVSCQLSLVCAPFLVAFLAKFMVHAVAPCKVRGPPTTPPRHRRRGFVDIVFFFPCLPVSNYCKDYEGEARVVDIVFFPPASLCQRVPPVRGAPMAPTTARTTRVRRVWLVCVVVGVGQRAHPRYSPWGGVPTEPRMSLGGW